MNPRGALDPWGGLDPSEGLDTGEMDPERLDPGGLYVEEGCLDPGKGWILGRGRDAPIKDERCLISIHFAATIRYMLLIPDNHSGFFLYLFSTKSVSILPL